jgi:hypothetical protein
VRVADVIVREGFPEGQERAGLSSVVAVVDGGAVVVADIVVAVVADALVALVVVHIDTTATVATVAIAAERAKWREEDGRVENVHATRECYAIPLLPILYDVVPMFLNAVQVLCDVGKCCGIF